MKVKTPLQRLWGFDYSGGAGVPPHRFIKINAGPRLSVFLIQ